MANMSNADVWTFSIAFAVVLCFLGAIRDRLKRIEGKIGGCKSFCVNDLR